MRKFGNGTEEHTLYDGAGRVTVKLQKSDRGELSGASDFGYLDKQHDPTSRLYNYGYRDYKPQTARFTTIDPIRDGTNWFSYCNGDPVNFIDFWGLCTDEPNLAGVPPQYRDILIQQKQKQNNRKFIVPTEEEILLCTWKL